MGLKPLDLVEIGTLTFERPDVSRFPALNLAYEAIRRGQTFPVIMNAANEIAVSAFLKGRISFLQIPDVVSYAMAHHEPTGITLKTVLDADRQGRKLAENFIEQNLREAS